MRDDRLDKLASIYTEAIGKLLNAKGMMKYRGEMEDRIEKVMGELPKKVVPQVEDVKKKPTDYKKEYEKKLGNMNQFQLRSLATKKGIPNTKVTTKKDLIERLMKHEG